MELDQTIHQLDILKQQHATRLQEKETEHRLEREHRDLQHDGDIKFFQQLKELNADITQIMVAQQRNPDKLIQIVQDKETTVNTNSASSNVHFVNNI
jgi:hypothetical protein